MSTKTRKEYYDWISTGIAATSLALIVFVPKIEIENEVLKWIVEAFFISAVSFAVSATAISKEADVFDVKFTESVKGAHNTSLLICLLLFVSGFALLCFSIKWYLLIVFGISFLLAYGLFKYAQNRIIQP
jgi:hypothetical protein